MDGKKRASRRLADWIEGFGTDGPVNARLKKEVRGRILDLVSAAAAGWKVNPVYNKAAEEMISSYAGTGKSTGFFEGFRLPAPMAAYMNASYGHGADLDDGHRTANGHPGVVVIPAVLALAEEILPTADEVEKAIAVGYEVYVRLSNAVQPELLMRGFHGTGVVGTVAAAAACAKLLGLGAEKIHDAISLGAIQAAGLFEVSESGQMTKPINPAGAARSGMEAALLARSGVDAPSDPLEGKKGFFRAFAGAGRPEALDIRGGDELKIYSCYIKMSPACRHVHPCIDAGCALRKKRKVRAEEIKEIVIETYPNAIFVTGNIAEPKNSDEAKFSMRYALAVALREGRYSFMQLAAASAMDEETRALIRKMRIISDPSFENKEKSIRGCRVTIHYLDGEKAETTVLIPKGDAENPLGEKERREKFHDCLDGIFSDSRQQAIYDSIFAEDFQAFRLSALMKREKV